MLSDREEMEDAYGYQHYHCRKHGGFWSDSGPYCEGCGDPEPEDEAEADNA